MSKKAKLIISVVGISAVVVPALLLIFLTGREPQSKSSSSSDKRQIDTKLIEDTVKKNMPSPIPTPSPSPIPTPSPNPVEGTGSSQ